MIICFYFLLERYVACKVELIPLMLAGRIRRYVETFTLRDRGSTEYTTSSSNNHYVRISDSLNCLAQNGIYP